MSFTGIPYQSINPKGREGVETRRDLEKLDQKVGEQIENLNTAITNIDNSVTNIISGVVEIPFYWA